MLIKKIFDLRYRLLLISIGIAYFWFGFLKFFHGVSPAEDLAKITISHLTFGLIPDNVSIILLAFWETLIGICLIFNKFNKFILICTLLHMLCTFTPFLFLPHISYHSSIFSLTLVGQYIVKNLIIVFALLVIYADRYKEAFEKK